VHADGFARTVEAWLRRLEPVLDAQDAFSRERARQLIEAAQVFDATGSRDVAEFVQFAGRHVVRDAETAVGVRVMTIHKSKGLGFDVVVLPDLEGNSLATRRSDGLAVQRSAEREVEWVLDLPPKLFYENDAALSAHAEEGAADAGYEKLCLFYVAMTRAKRALYLVTKEPAEKSQSDNFPRLLAATLGTRTMTAAPQGRVGAWNCAAVYADGDADWFKLNEGAVVIGSDSTKETRGLKAMRDLTVVERHPARTPSGEKAGLVTGGDLFGAASAGAAGFGTALHRALAEVEWGGETPELLQAWVDGGLGETVIAEARACLEAEGLTQVFERKDGAEVWRERRFEIVIDGIWITGVFDRVVLERGDDGRLLAATVYDFKTDRVPGNEGNNLSDRYAGQMGIYRQAAARLADLPEVKVRCVLVSTSERRLIEATRDRAD
jgi:ATP-dependent helicase/nuclease subunit A